MHISNFIHRNGEAWNAISFAEQQVIENQFRNQLNYSFLCLGALLTIFLDQLFIFMFRKLDFGSVHLALFAITILIRLIVTPISLIEYFVEAEMIYKNLQAYMQLENQYQKVMANIYKNEL